MQFFVNCAVQSLLLTGVSVVVARWTGVTCTVMT